MEMKETADQPTLPFESPRGAHGIPVTSGPIIPSRPKPQPPVRPHENGPAAKILIAVCLLGVIYGTQSALRRVAAEWLIREGSAESLEWATKLTPENPLAWRRLARTRSDSVAALRRAAELAPGESQSWVDLALALEAQRDFDGAERALERAAGLDPGFLPRWSLANLHLRQGREEEFWAATRDAIQADRSQLPLAAALSWRAFDDPDLVLERAVPNDAQSLQAFLYYLIRRGDIPALTKVWLRYEPSVRAADVPILAELLSDLLVAGEVELALSMWNTLIDRDLLEFQPLDALNGPFLTNSGFERRITGLGFDWKASSTSGVTRVQRLRRGLEKTIEIQLSGGQEESALLLEQAAPAPADADLVLRFTYATQRLPFETGLVWRVRDRLTGTVLAETGSLEASEEKWTSGELAVRTSGDTRLVAVEFSYERAPGTDRYRGNVALRSAMLVRANGGELPN